jgi:hypothetical protein
MGITYNQTVSDGSGSLFFVPAGSTALANTAFTSSVAEVIRYTLTSSVAITGSDFSSGSTYYGPLTNHRGNANGIWFSFSTAQSSVPNVVVHYNTGSGVYSSSIGFGSTRTRRTSETAGTSPNTRHLFRGSNPIQNMHLGHGAKGAVPTGSKGVQVYIQTDSSADLIVSESVFAINEATFLRGYVSASSPSTGKIDIKNLTGGFTKYII